jgi:hypothetical protein
MLTKSQRLVSITGAWMLLALTVLTLLHMLSYEYYFVLCLAGFTVIVLSIGPFTMKPGWRARVNLALILGALGFTALMAIEMLGIVGIRLFS